MNKPKLNEQELVSEVLAGNGRAARELYKLLEKQLKRYFGEKTAQHADVDELVQDTFLHVLDALPLFRFQSSLKTFALSIASHEAADYWRKKYAKKVIKTVPALREMQTVAYSSERVSQVLNEAVERAYASIQPTQANLLRWKYEEGRSVKEIAQELGWSAKAVEAKLYRARKAFQLAYEEPERYE